MSEEDARLLPLWRSGIVIGVALMALLALTLVLAYVPLGGFNGPVSYAIAMTKALLVAFVFMKLRSSSMLLALAALAGLFWLSTLFALTLTDYPFRLVGEQGITFPASGSDSPAQALPDPVF